MFPFGGKKHKQVDQQPDQQQKQKNRMDKLIMGAIIGVAVGSVVGMAVAPQKGKATRKFIAEKGKEAIEKGMEMSDAFFRKPKKKEKLLGKIVRKLVGRRHKQIAPLKEIPGEEVNDNEEMKNL
jgi:gas vesicle protein